MKTRSQVYLWAAQRISAMVLAFCVLVHLVNMIYAIRGGLSASEILGRTRGSLAWGAFYSVFVVAVSVHAAVGLRSILGEWSSLRGKALDATVPLVMLFVLGFGLRAVWAVVIG